MGISARVQGKETNYSSNMYTQSLRSWLHYLQLFLGLGQICFLKIKGGEITHVLI